MLEADIEACFDMIDHTALMARVRQRVGDKRVLRLVKAFLKSAVMTTTGRMATVTQRQRRKYYGQANYRLVRYADDFVVLVTGQRQVADRLRAEVATVLAPMGLRLSPEKPRGSPRSRHG